MRRVEIAHLNMIYKLNTKWKKLKDAVKNADNEKFVNIIQHYSCIWNTSFDESKDKDKNIRENAWKKVVELFRENIRLKRIFSQAVDSQTVEQ